MKCPVVSRREAHVERSIATMRMLVEVRREDEDPLRKLAIWEHRSVREQCGYLLHLKIQEELARLRDLEPKPVGEVA
jgi:hypothetical protein